MDDAAWRTKKADAGSFGHGLLPHGRGSFFKEWRNSDCRDRQAEPARQGVPRKSRGSTGVLGTRETKQDQRLAILLSPMIFFCHLWMKHGDFQVFFLVTYGTRIVTYGCHLWRPLSSKVTRCMKQKLLGAFANGGHLRAVSRRFLEGGQLALWASSGAFGHLREILGELRGESSVLPHSAVKSEQLVAASGVG